MRYKIRLDKESDVLGFVNTVSKLEGKITVTDGDNKVDGKSLLGMLYAMTFNELWCESDTEIFKDIMTWVI